MLTKILFFFLISLNFSGLEFLSVKSSFQFSISSIKSLIKDNGWNCSDVVDFFIQRTYKYNYKFNAIIAANSKAYDQAKILDDYYYTNKAFMGKLHCIPFVVKDNIDFAGMPTTGGISPLRHSFPSKNAVVITRLLNEGAVVISKSNLGELASAKDNSETGGYCKNPFDSKRSCGPSSIGTGAAIAVGFGVVGLGTDTEGSIQCPASYNGLYGLRPPQNIPEVDGIIPAFTRQDTVGPFSKYIDDLVLTHSIMANDTTVYTQYSNSVDASTLKVGYFTNFVNNFTVTDGVNTLNHWLDPEVKDQTDKTIQKLKNLNIAVYNYTLSFTEMAAFLIKFQTCVQAAATCMSSCKKFSLNNYFSDSSRYETDAPVENFNDLITSPLLSTYWRNDLSASNVSDATIFCSTNCASYDTNSPQFTSIISEWFDRNGIDSLLFPTRVQLPYLVNQTQPNTIPSFLTIASITGYSSLNIPVGYSSSSTDAPDGLPIGMLLISKPSRLVNSFKIAKLFETSYGIVKLPSSAPLISVSSSNKISIHNNQILFSLLIFILVLFKS